MNFQISMRVLFYAIAAGFFLVAIKQYLAGRKD